MARGRGDGSIFQRGDSGKWVVMFTTPEGKRRTLYANSRDEARDKLHAAQENVKKLLPVPYARLKLAEYLDRWLKDVATQRVRPKTLKRYRLDIARIKKGLGSLRMAELTPAKVQTFIASLSDAGLSPASVKHCRAVLRTALAQAEKEGVVGRNVAKLVTLPRDMHKPVTVISPEIARAILDAHKGDEFEPLVRLALATGLRQGELLGLKWEHVDLDAATLRVVHQLQRIDGAYVLTPPKSERSRRPLSLGSIAMEALRAQKLKQTERRLLLGPAWKDTGLVFTTADGGELAGSTVTHHFQATLRKAGITGVRFHDLRHGAATLLLLQGADVRRVQAQLGHSTIVLTASTYAHVLPALLKDNADLLDRALGAEHSG